MLQSLHIRHFAIIDDVQLEFGPGLNILSGETGAGKSIIIQAVGLLMGQRGSSDWIRKGEKEAIVTGLFELQKKAPLYAQLADWGVPLDEPELVIQRKVSAQGRSQVRLNGMPATVGMLTDIGDQLMDIVSQKEHELLLKPEMQRELLDQYGALTQERASYQEQLQTVLSIQDELTALQAGDRSNREMEEFLRFQIKEINEAELKPAEDEELKSEKGKIRHASKLGEFCTWADQLLLNGDTNLIGALGQLEARLLKASELDVALEPWVAAVQSIQSQLDDLSQSLSAYLEGLQFDPGRLEGIESRLAELDRLKRKYGESVAVILQHADEVKEKLNLLENFDERVEQLESDLAVQADVLLDLDKKLQVKRNKAAKKLAVAVMKELADLNMAQAEFQVVWQNVVQGGFESQKKCFDRFGSKRAVFYLVSNPGEDPQPLAKIASGGERSRILLAVKKVLVEFADLGTSIYDEVDEGVGGATASKIGDKLAEIAKQRQVVCITHQPQIAAYAQNHFVIEKEFGENRTATQVRQLSDDEREQELARMLAGKEITSQARDHAKELLRGVAG